MRILILKYWIFIIAIRIVLQPFQCDGQHAKGNLIKEDSMNLAILVLDFQSYEFHEADVAYYPLCDSCDLDSLPYIIEFMTPMDYGEIIFNYSHTLDTLFYASIWWLGTGEIIFPQQFLSSSSFGYHDESVALPEHAEYFDYWLIPNYYSEQQFKEKADSAWMSIDSLQMVNEFSAYSFRVGIYAYTPAVGMFDPNKAKWIIFLYYGNTFTTDITEINSPSLPIKLSPNPFTTSTTLSYTLDKPSAVCISIYNPQGQLIEKIEQEQMKGEQKMQWNAAGLPAGMYYVRIQIGDKVSGGKMIKGSDL